MKLEGKLGYVTKAGVGLGLLALTSLNYGCGVVNANRSMYAPNIDGNITTQQRVETMDTYQKNLFRNFTEVADDVAKGKKEVAGGMYGVVQEMQTERDKDYAIGVGVLLTNAAVTGAIIYGVTGGDESTKTRGPNGSMGAGSPNRNIDDVTTAIKVVTPNRFIE